MQAVPDEWLDETHNDLVNMLMEWQTDVQELQPTCSLRTLIKKACGLAHRMLLCAVNKRFLYQTIGPDTLLLESPKVSLKTLIDNVCYDANGANQLYSDDRLPAMEHFVTQFREFRPPRPAVKRLQEPRRSQRLLQRRSPRRSPRLSASS